MDVFLLFGAFHGSRLVTDGKNNGIRGNIKYVAFFISCNDLAFRDFAESGFEMYGNLIGLEEVTQIAGVCKTDTLGRDEVILHFNDGRLLAVQIKLICDFATGQTAADNDNVFANRLLTEEIINRFDRSIRALHGNLSRLCTGSNDDLVCIERGDILNFRIHLYGDCRIFRKLSFIPGDEHLILLFERGSCGRNEYTAKLIGLFIESDTVTALCAEDRGFHTADTAADHGDLLLLLCGFDIIFLGLHGDGVQSATRKSHRIGEVLRIGMTLGGGEIEAARVATDTGLDIFDSIFDELGDPFGVGEELTGNTHGINLAFRNCLCTDIRFHSARANNGNINEFLDVSNVIEVTVLGHIHRRMCPVPGVVGTVISVQHIVAGILKIFCRFFGFRHITSDFDVIFSGHCTVAEILHLGFYGVSERYGIIVAAGFLDRLYDFSGKAVTVFEATAVFVTALVKEFDCELVEQIAFVNGVYFNTVNACVTAKLCSLCERFNDLVDLLYGHFGALDIVRPTGFLRAGASKLMIRVNDGLDQRAREFVFVKRSNQFRDRPGTTHACGQLNEELRTRLMDLIHEFLQVLEHLRILPKPFAEEGIA